MYEKYNKTDITKADKEIPTQNFKCFLFLYRIQGTRTMRITLEIINFESANISTPPSATYKDMFGGITKLVSSTAIIKAKPEIIFHADLKNAIAFSNV